MKAIIAKRDVAVPYFVSQFLTTFSQSLPHAILTPLLLGKGLSLSQILIMQAAFSGAVLVSEFPSGVLADLIGRRVVYIVSRIALIAFYLAVIFGSGFPFLLAAWIVYGVAAALDSGTLDAALVNNAKTVPIVSTPLAGESRGSFVKAAKPRSLGCSSEAR